MPRIPVYQPDLSGNEIRYVEDCLRTNWISSKGDYIERFESSLANWIGVTHAASVCNGTVALHLALLAMHVGPNHEVILPSFTYVAPVNAVRYVGATPVFVDSDPATWQLDAKQVEQRVTKATRAVIAPHIYGGACDVDTLRQICDHHGLHLIEDCAEALGTLLRGRHVGTQCDIATYSFFGNKTITTGEGGMVTTNSAEIDRKVRHLKGQGLAQGREYWHDVLGYNYRMTNICAAIGFAQLERVEQILAAKRDLARRYQSALADTSAVFQMPTPGEESSYWMVTVLLPDSDTRDKARSALARQGIETRPTFNPVHRMPMYRDLNARCPVSDDLAARGINLPSWHQLTLTDIEEICDVLKPFVT